MRDALILTPLHTKEFTAPDRAVETVASTVPRHAEVRAFDTVLCRASRDVRLVMLHADDRKSRLFRPLRGCVVRMQVADNGLRLERVKPTEIIDGPFESQPRFKSLKVADVLAEEHVIADSNRDRVLQMSTNGEYGRNGA